MRFPGILLWLGAILFLGVGLTFLLWPLPASRLVEIIVPTPTARADFAATYGGLQIAFGIFLSICARRPGWYRAGLVAMGLALAGFGLGRLHGIIFSGGAPKQMIYWFLALELAGAVLTFLVLRDLNRKTSGSE